MASLDLTTIDGVRGALASGELPARDVCRASLESIEAQNSSLNAFNLVATEQALARAEALDRLAPSERGPAARRPHRDQGQHVHAWPRHDGVVEDPRAATVPPYDATVVDAARARRRGHRRQDQLRRVRDGLVHRELRVRTDAQPVGPDAHARRIERRIGRRGRRRHGAGRARVRHRRIDPPAGRALRRRRPQADLRPRLALRAAGVRLVARSDRPA